MGYHIKLNVVDDNVDDDGNMMKTLMKVSMMLIKLWSIKRTNCLEVSYNV